MMPKPLKNRAQIIKNRGLGPSGGHLGAIWGTSGAQGGLNDEKHDSFPVRSLFPGVPLEGHFSPKTQKSAFFRVLFSDHRFSMVPGTIFGLFWCGFRDNC